MRKIARLFSAALATALVLAALLGPAALAATAGSASPDARAGWPLCEGWGGTTFFHCHTPRECQGRYQVIEYWDWVPVNLAFTERTGAECV